MTDPRPSKRRYEIALWIDKRLGPALCGLLLILKRLTGRRRSARAPEDVHRILLLKMWGMGSIVLATPLLARLREHHPNARIDLVTLHENEAIARLLPGFDRIVGIDLSHGVLQFFWNTLRTIAALRREHYDLLLDLEFFTRFSAAFSFLVGADWSHGFSAKGSFRGRLHDVEIPFNAYAHVASNFLTLLTGDYMNPLDPALVEAPDALPLLTVPESEWQSCCELLRADPAWREGEALVVVNPNAGDMAIERRWPTERVAELLRQLTARHPVNVVLIGSPAERDHVASVVRESEVSGRLVDLAGRTSIEQVVALLAHADVVVTNDSGPMHIAAAAGSSTVALFGPETPTLYHPLRARPEQRHAIHTLNLGCSPCMFVHDNKVLSCWFSQAKCMSGILPADVLASVEALLAGEEPKSAGEEPKSAEPQLRVVET